MILKNVFAQKVIKITLFTLFFYIKFSFNIIFFKLNFDFYFHKTKHLKIQLIKNNIIQNKSIIFLNWRLSTQDPDRDLRL